MTANEIFATTPRRVLHSKTQSVDRNGFSSRLSGTENRPEITFDALKSMAPSSLRAGSHTPSRMVKGRRVLPNSEQPSRISKPSINVRGKDVNANLLEKLRGNEEVKPCLKWTKKPQQAQEIKDADASDNDLTTSLNTIKNAESAKNVKKFLQNTDDFNQPRKKRRAVTFTTELDKIEEYSSKKDVHEILEKILKNQQVIMAKLDDLESRLP